MAEPDPDTSRILVETRIARPVLPEGGFRLRSGESLPELEIAYEIYGTLNPDKSNAVLICSPLTTDAHAAGWHEGDRKPGWWDDMIGPGKAIDTDRYCVIAQNMLGGCRGTTGPASRNPATGKPYGSAFPRITVEDMVAVQRLLVVHLGIDVLEAVIGGSMGGMQSLEWSVAYPDKVRKCICIAAAAGLSAQALGFEIIGRKSILSDPDYQGGDYYGTGRQPDGGLAYARMIGHLTYLSAISMHQKFGRARKEIFDAESFESGFEVESYLDHQGSNFVKRFDANSYLHITWAMDSFDLQARHGSLEKAFGKSGAEFLLVALSSDWLFPPAQTRELGEVLLRLKKVVSVVELDSPYGHDAFLLEVANLSQVIHGFLEKPAYLEPARPAAPPRRRPKPRGALGRPKPDWDLISELVEPGSHILDIGCGDGGLIDALFRSQGVTGIGIEVRLEHVVACLRRNVPVIQANVDRGLPFLEDDTFDYAVLNRTLPEIRRPRELLRTLLRVAPRAIVAFPNFGHAGNRASLLLRGTMPVTRALPLPWHETPNIHLFSLKDFEALCASEGYCIEALRTQSGSPWSRALLALGCHNLGAETVVAQVARGRG